MTENQQQSTRQRMPETELTVTCGVVDEPIGASMKLNPSGAIGDSGKGIAPPKTKIGKTETVLIKLDTDLKETSNAEASGARRRSSRISQSTLTSIRKSNTHEPDELSGASDSDSADFSNAPKSSGRRTRTRKNKKVVDGLYGNAPESKTLDFSLLTAVNIALSSENFSPVHDVEEKVVRKRKRHCDPKNLVDESDSDTLIALPTDPVIANGVGNSKDHSLVVKNFLLRWLFRHKENPYPSLRLKKKLADICSLSVKQVEDFMVNGTVLLT